MKVFVILLALSLGALAVPAVPCWWPNLTAALHPVTLYEPMSGFYALDKLTLAVKAPRVWSRTSPLLSVGNCQPLSQSVGLLDQCNDWAKGAFQWADIVDADGSRCGDGAVERTLNTPDIEEYTGVLTATYSESLINPNIHGPDSMPLGRIWRTEMIFKVRFLKTVAATADNLRVYGEPVPKVAVTAVETFLQRPADGSDDYIRLGYIVAVQKPFVPVSVESFSIPGYPGAYSHQAAPVQEMEDANHTYRGFKADLHPRSCEFTMWTNFLIVRIKCLDLADPLCPIHDPEGVLVTLSFDVEIAPYCPVLVEIVSASAIISTWADAAYTNPTLAYFLGEKVYMKGELSCADVTLDGAAIKNMTAEGAAVISPPALLSPFPPAQITQIDPYDYRWWFILDPLVFQALEHGFFDLRLTVWWDVHFLGNLKRLNKDIPKGMVLKGTHSVAIASDHKAAASRLSPWF